MESFSLFAALVTTGIAFIKVKLHCLAYLNFRTLKNCFREAGVPFIISPTLQVLVVFSNIRFKDLVFYFPHVLDRISPVQNIYFNIFFIHTFISAHINTAEGWHLFDDISVKKQKHLNLTNEEVVPNAGMVANYNIHFFEIKC